MKQLYVLAAIAAVFCALGSPAEAAIQFGQNVTNDYFNGTGVDNGFFTTDRNASAGVELGLRAHVRFPASANTFNNSGSDNVYGPFAAGGFGTGGTRASWNFDWSINVNYLGLTGRSLDDLTYSLQLDYDPSTATNFGSWDVINNPGAVGSIDHSFGNNATTDSTGENNGDETEGTLVNYASLIGDPNFNIAQNSGQLNFFNLALGKSFDPTVDGTYDIRLSAFDGANLLASTGIQVIVGAGGLQAVPEASALLIWGGLAACGAVIAWRKKAAAA